MLIGCKRRVLGWGFMKYQGRNVGYGIGILGFDLNCLVFKEKSPPNYWHVNLKKWRSRGTGHVLWIFVWLVPIAWNPSHGLFFLPTQNCYSHRFKTRNCFILCFWFHVGVAYREDHQKQSSQGRSTTGIHREPQPCPTPFYSAHNW